LLGEKQVGGGLRLQPGPKRKDLRKNEQYRTVRGLRNKKTISWPEGPKIGGGVEIQRSTDETGRGDSINRY